MLIEIYRYSNKVGEIDLAQVVPIDELSSGEIIVGRSEEAVVHLNDRMVSREHAVLSVKDKCWNIKCSAGELALNGSPITDEAIKNGDSITVGPFQLIARIDESLLDQIGGVGSSTEDELEFDASLQIDIVNEGQTLTGLDNSKELEFDQVVEIEEETMMAPEEEIVVEDVDDDVEFGVAEEADQEFAQEPSEYEDAENYSDQEYAEEYEEGYEEGGYDVDTLDDDDGTRVLSGFANYYLEILGEYAPYDNYSINDEKIVIGRHAEKCQIILNDPEVSSVHASIQRVGSDIFLEDLQSGNGTLLNGERINKSSIQNGDEFVIGSTSFSLKIKSSFLKEQVNTLMPVEDNQEIEIEEIIEIEDNAGEEFEGFEEEEEKSALKRAWKDPKKKRLIIIGGVIFAFLMFLPEDTPKKKPDQKNAKTDANSKNKVDPKKQQRIKEIYKIATDLAATKKYEEALMQLEQLLVLAPKNSEGLTLKSYISEALQKIAKEEQRLRREEEKRLLKEKVKRLIEDAKKAVADRNVSIAETLFQKIAELDPDNFDLPLLKNDLRAWQQEEERKAIAEAQKKAERARQVKELEPGKKFYLRKEWYKATLKLEAFLNLKKIDEDLLKSATEMLKESRDNLERVVSPLVGKARSLKEGQDLKGAYEVYSEILDFDPTHRESLNEMNRIREVLLLRSKKVYREAIVSESLSLFDEAKEKFQQVQQISPSDGKYYNLATEKLKEYID